VIEVRDLRKVFHSRAGDHTAVAGVSFDIPDGGAVALVGESGSGKTTTALMMVGLERSSGGEVLIDGRRQDTTRRPTRRERRRLAREVQMVFQDPYLSLDPRQKVGSGLQELLGIHFRLTERERHDRIRELLDQVGLHERHARVLPTALSGGQRQRVAIARALAVNPRALILDEAVAALDVSIQAQILNLLSDIRGQLGISYLFVSHDLAVVRQVSDTTLVMCNGEIVEQGATARMLTEPAHPYTRRLLASVPRPGWQPTRSNPLQHAVG
jgi:ABC-type oligopeptide transport system ATPase subunit